MKVRSNAYLAGVILAKINRHAMSKYAIAQAVAKRFGHTQAAVTSRIDRMRDEGKVNLDHAIELGQVLGFEIHIKGTDKS